MKACLYDELNNKTELGENHNQPLFFFTKADKNKLKNTYLEDIFSEL